MSLSSRRAWIERANFCRNRFCPTVALRKESVDRKSTALASSRAFTVALRKESVDRKAHLRLLAILIPVSLSARRAWIESMLLKFSKLKPDMSLSARRAWIERTFAFIIILKIKSRSPQGERG